MQLQYSLLLSGIYFIPNLKVHTYKIMINCSPEEKAIIIYGLINARKKEVWSRMISQESGREKKKRAIVGRKQNIM